MPGPKPDDLDLMSCFEEWSHNGTPEWVCSEELRSGASFFAVSMYSEQYVYC